MNSGLTWSVMVAGTLLALPALRADAVGGASALPAAYWMTGDASADPLMRRPAYRPEEGRRPGAAAPQPAPRPFGPGAAAALAFDSPVFNPHPLGWDDPAAPAVPRLPPYQVTDSRVRPISAPELYTRQGMIYQSFAAHPGLAYGNIFHTNENKAYEMYQEEHWNETKVDYWQTAFAMTVGGDAAEGRMIAQEINDEDLRMRSEPETGGNVPEIGQQQFGPQNGDSKVLEVIPVFPFNFPLVRVRW